ncbi:MAG: GNAT family N-acetyltransferase [Nocardioides sp.]|uniref:GNAT family N-acetyltransferase n=1 Tax=Nocardioides sp. TaxID=35761 RepID=UPI0039E5E099
MSTVLICPASVDDAEALTDLHLDVWDEAYGHLMPNEILRDRRKDRSERIERWRADIPSPESLTLLARDRATDRLIGFVSRGHGRDDSHDLPAVEVWALYVRAEFYGHGVGHAMLTEALGTSDAYLWVLDGNSRAVAFYERQGFRFDGSSKTETVGIERRMVRRGLTAG